MSIIVRNAAGLQLDEVINYAPSRKKSIEDYQATVKDFDSLPTGVQEAWIAEWEKELEADTGEEREVDLELLRELSAYTKLITRYANDARAALKDATIEVLSNFTTADSNEEKLKEIRELSGLINYTQLMSWVATYTGSEPRPKKATDMRKSDWAPIEGVKSHVVAKLATLAKMQ